ncbi:acidic repeat-containing protein [Orycteropus afer afer]|uniref:Acidic repeat-containing protein n=1 Tax=Orycteropus afer afer TaxID=1230840 RepID=A0A8B7BAE8_ORYAF|nr:acidic repeat-containing protein [Orycteropus afer afer]
MDYSFRELKTWITRFYQTPNASFYDLVVARMRMKKKRHNSCMAIASESDDEFLYEEKKVKMYETRSKVVSVTISFFMCSEVDMDELTIPPDEILEKSSDTDEQLTTSELPFLPINNDDSNDLEGPVLKEGNLYDEGQSTSNDRELGEFAVSQHNSSNDIGEQNLGENLCQSPNAAEPKLKIVNGKLSTDEELEPEVEQPKKKKKKTKNLSMTPAPAGRKRHGPSKRKPSSTKFEKCKTGNSVCKIPGCFLLDLEKSKQYSGKNFKQNKDELVQKIYKLFNSSVFDKKLPEKIDIRWNKKMLRTAGLCTTGETNNPKKERYAKIEIALKVCDSADRLRDTLIHEICHAASWLLDGVRDSHGDTWKYYANKSNMVHPELPKVTRCHNYKINYRIHYECTQCKSRVGRYTRSLNTEHFICGRCRGSLVVLPLTRKDGAPIKPHVRPFAKYVQENYRIVKQEMAGKGHGDVMKKLSKDYVASKQNQGR